MSIRCDCVCGHSMSVEDYYANVQLPCPNCRETLTVPAPNSSSGSSSSSHEGVQRELQDAGKKWGSPQHRDEDYDYNSSRRREIDSRFIKQSPAPTGGFGSINAGVGGGLAMMAVGALIFLVCLGLNRISIYGPILFVLGLIALLRGAFRSNE